MYQPRRAILNKNGFTLLEALFQLVIFSLFAQLIILFILFIHQQNTSILSDDIVDWEIFVRDLQQYLVQVDEIQVDYHSVNIIYKGREHIKINKSGDVLWLQINDKGYVPMLIGVHIAEFSVTNDYLSIKVEFTNGLVKERALFVQYDK